MWQELRAEKRAWRRRALLASAGLLVTLLILAWHAARAAAPGECRPVSLAVIAGDTEARDVAYVLDTCGQVSRLSVTRSGPLRPAHREGQASE